MPYRGPGTYKPKICAGCGLEFEPKSGVAKWCSNCGGGRGNPQQSIRWSRENPERAAAMRRKASRRHRHKREFGDPDAYEKAVTLHGEVCWICGRGPDADAGRFHLVIDRDHKTDQQRGLLCPRCNTGLGFFEDDPTRLRKAAEYLER